MASTSVARVVHLSRFVERRSGARSLENAEVEVDERDLCYGIAQGDQAGQGHHAWRGGSWRGAWDLGAHWASAVLYNGLGRYDKALEAAQRGPCFPPPGGRPRHSRPLAGPVHGGANGSAPSRGGLPGHAWCSPP